MNAGTAGMPAAMGDIGTDEMAILSRLTDMRYILTTVIGFIVYFIGGYLLYAAMFAAVGSAVDNEKDTQNLQLPITVPLILAIVVMVSAMQDPNSQIAFWFSMIPFTSPVIMMARLPYGVPMWELLVSVGLLYLTFVGTARYTASESSCTGRNPRSESCSSGSGINIDVSPAAVTPQRPETLPL